MKTVLQKSLSVVLVVLTLAFTSGVSVFNHYCNCSKQTISSVFVEITCEQSHGSACCGSKTEQLPACCSHSATENSCTHQSRCNAEGCCRTDITIIQIESEYQVSQTRPVDQLLVLIAEKFFNEIVEKPKEPIQIAEFYTDTSPPLTGRQFLTAVHQLKLDIPVC